MRDDAVPAHDSVYVTQGWQAADERAIGVLLDEGRTPMIVSVGRDVHDAAELHSAVAAEAAGGRVVVVAASVPAAVAGALGGVGGGQVRVRPSVDLDAFPFHAPWIDAFLLGVPPHAHLVLSLRGHRPENRIDDVITAFGRIPRRHDVHEDFPDPHLLIGHDGPVTADLRRSAAASGVADRTRFLGTVPTADLVPLLGRGACYVSASAEDVVPSSLLQAMACGTPVIAAATPTAEEWVVDGVTGFTYPAGDVAALAAVMSAVIETYPTDVVQRARRVVEERADWGAAAEDLRRALTDT